MPRGLIAAVARRLGRPAHVVDDQKVQAAVLVVVDPDAADRPVPARDSGGRRHVLEAPRPGVAEQLVVPDAGDEEIDVAVVVVVGGGGAHGVAGSAHARGIGHVGEAQPALVAEEAIGILRRGLLQRWGDGAVREKDVGLPVVVVVQHREPARARSRRSACPASANADGRSADRWRPRRSRTAVRPGQRLQPPGPATRPASQPSPRPRSRTRRQSRSRGDSSGASA